jgi:uncharacterized surface protein with fasciclin (FAS1) repeats
MQERKISSKFIKLSLLAAIGAFVFISLPTVAQIKHNPAPLVAGGAPSETTRPTATEPAGQTPPSGAPAGQTETAPQPEAAPAPGEAPPTGEAPTPAAGGNIVALASSSDSFKTLTTALQAAGLGETLSGEGPFTVFAPTDQAFAALPPGTLQELLKPENKQTLVRILTYHVVPGKVLSGDLKSGQVKTVEGRPVTVRVSPDKKVSVNGANVTQADIQASNGVIHAIDQVILPPGVRVGGGRRQ